MPDKYILSGIGIARRRLPGQNPPATAPQRPAGDHHGCHHHSPGSAPAGNERAEPAARPPATWPRRRVNQPPRAVRAWFDAAAAAAIPDHDGTLGTARRAARAYAHRAKADNTRRAYRAGVRAWCAWCEQHALPCLPASAADVTAFLAAEHGRGASVATVGLRRAAIRYLHFIAGCPVPTAQAQVAETMAGIHRTAADQGALPAQETRRHRRHPAPDPRPDRPRPAWDFATAPCCWSASPARYGAPSWRRSGSTTSSRASAACA